MRIPRNITFNKDNSVIEETITIDEYEKLDYPYIELSEVDDILIKKIERVVRSSLEMREYREFLRQELHLDRCHFFSNLDYEDISIELHHGPLTLYEVTDIVLRKQMTENINVTIWDVAEEITRLHYENKVGLIPLSVTTHQLLHQGQIFIGVQYFYGDWKSFYMDYKKYFTNDQIALLNEYVKQSKEIEKDQQIPDILARRYTYLEINGQEYPCKIELEQKKKKID